MAYKSWNDYFRNYHDDKHTPAGASCLMQDIDDFDYAYRRKFGSWFDHHAIELIKEYGSEKGMEIIEKNVEAINEEKRLAIEKEKQLHEFHDVPADEMIPF